MVSKEKKKEWYNNSKNKAKSYPSILTCSLCKEEKSSSLFYKCCVNPSGFQYNCKQCVSLKQKDIYKKFRKEKIRKATVRNRKAKYGVTEEMFNEILSRQENKCAICASALDGSKFSLNGHLDHCHKTGRVRGILCGQCNTALGNFKDEVNILKAAIYYLECDQ